MNNATIQQITQFSSAMTESELQQALSILEENRKAAKKRNLQAKKSICRGLRDGYAELQRFQIESVNGTPTSKTVVALGTKTLEIEELDSSHALIPDTDSMWWVGNYVAYMSQTNPAAYHYYWWFSIQQKAAVRPALVFSDIESAGLKIGDKIVIGGETLTVISPALALRNECLPTQFSCSDKCKYAKNQLKHWYKTLAKKAALNNRGESGK